MPFFFLKDATGKDLETGTVISPSSVSWTEFFILGTEIGMVLEVGMGGAMVGSSSWMTKVMRVGMAEKEERCSFGRNKIAGTT